MAVTRPSPGRPARPRHLVMCPPRHFAVTYSINPWMRPAEGVDRVRALDQWRDLRDTYVRLGHRVEEIEPVPGLPDLVFTANAGLVLGDRVLISRFHHSERTGEEDVFHRWFRAAGFTVTQAALTNEGEGDYLVTGQGILAGTGFRSAAGSTGEAAAFARRPVIPLRLVDPRFYHLDTALAVLDPETIAYWPGAFSERSRAVLRRRFPDAVLATEADAAAFGLNAFSDGRHVVMADGAPALADRLADRGYEPVLVDTSELQKAGGSVKCCTLVVHPAAATGLDRIDRIDRIGRVPVTAGGEDGPAGPGAPSEIEPEAEAS